MVASLLGAKLADRREDTKGITSQHNDVAWVGVNDTRDLGARDEVDGVSATSVFGDADIIVIWDAGSWVVNDVFKDRAVADGPEDIWLLLGGEVDAFGIAATLNVEDTSIGPDVLVITDE